MSFISFKPSCVAILINIPAHYRLPVVHEVLAARMRKILSHEPLLSWLVFTRRHALWPLHWVWPYFRVIVTSLKYSILNPFARRRERA